MVLCHSAAGRSAGRSVLCAVLVAGAAGIVFSLFHAFAAIHMKADQVISGTALNTFAPAFCIFIARTFQQTQQIQFENVFRIESVPVLGSIPIIGDLLFKNTYITTYIGLLFLVLLCRHSDFRLSGRYRRTDLRCSYKQCV